MKTKHLVHVVGKSWLGLLKISLKINLPLFIQCRIVIFFSAFVFRHRITSIHSIHSKQCNYNQIEKKKKRNFNIKEEENDKEEQ